MEYFNPRTIITKDKLEGEYGYFYKEIIHDLTNRIPKDVADRIIKENNDPNYTILIHRTAMITAEKVFEQGLEIRGGDDLDYTTDRYTDDMVMLININGASGYKNRGNRDSRVIIAKIPNSALKYQPGITKPILYQTNNAAEQSGGLIVLQSGFQTVLLPEYILGSIEYRGGKIINFVENENYTDVHNYKNDGLVCPEETIFSYLNSHRKDFPANIDSMESITKTINNIIISENNRYMINPEMYTKTQRTADSLKKYSLKNLTMSKFKQIVTGFSRFFSQDKEKENGSSR